MSREERQQVGVQDVYGRHRHPTCIEPGKDITAVEVDDLLQVNFADAFECADE